MAAEIIQSDASPWRDIASDAAAVRAELPVLIKARALIADPAKWGKGVRNGQ